MQPAKDLDLEPGVRKKSGAPDFQVVLEQSVTEGLRQVVGESGLQMLLSLHPLPSLAADPLRFHQAMTEIFQERGAHIIECEIARILLRNTADQVGKDRPHHRWSGLVALAGAPNHSVTSNEKKILKRFVELATLPSDGAHRSELVSHHNRQLEASIELTSQRFAAAFKK